MLASWTQKFQVIQGKGLMAGWRFDDEADCRSYLAARVKAKLLDSDPAALLHDYIVELADTGFDTSSLQSQASSPPRPKDWEVGEAFAEVMLEDRFEASFPWPTAWDKRTPKASLPGPDIPGFHRKNNPRFLFGEVKSSSELRFPPQVATSGEDCLCEQIKRLLSSHSHRQQLVKWLLVRTKDSPAWKPVFEAAIQRYAAGDACICGILVRGGTSPTADDLEKVHNELAAISGSFDILLLGFYLPFDKSTWVDLVYAEEIRN
jgi:hypothetical protein